MKIGMVVGVRPDGHKIQLRVKRTGEIPGTDGIGIEVELPALPDVDAMMLEIVEQSVAISETTSTLVAAVRMLSESVKMAAEAAAERVQEQNEKRIIVPGRPH